MFGFYPHYPINSRGELSRLRDRQKVGLIFFSKNFGSNGLGIYCSYYTNLMLMVLVFHKCFLDLQIVLYFIGTEFCLFLYLEKCLRLCNLSDFFLIKKNTGTYHIYTSNFFKFLMFNFY